MIVEGRCFFILAFLLGGQSCVWSLCEKRRGKLGLLR